MADFAGVGFDYRLEKTQAINKDSIQLRLDIR